MSEVMVARIYLTESENQLSTLLTYLHDEAKVRGVTVFRGISGFGQSGELHRASLLDLSLDLPLVIEFFDKKEKVEMAVSHIKTLTKLEHILQWQAETS